MENCLFYKDFHYLKHEWDNIPIIVPRYLIYLSKYINGLANFCKRIDDGESTISLREDFGVKVNVRVTWL